VLELTMRLAAALLIACAGTASAQQYRWTDESGRVRYSDTLPPASAKNVQKLRLAPGPADPARALEDAARRNPVRLYTSPNCEAPCRDARQLLDQRGVPFAEVTVFDEPSHAELQRVAGAASIPTLVVGDKVLVGLARSAWSAALDAAEYPSTPPKSAGEARSRLAVSLYTNSECGELCSEARAYLEARNVPFTEVSVEAPADVDKLRSLTGAQNVPVLTVGTLVQRGYDPALYARALSYAGYPEASNQ
jgi:arsenate reductase-like glutaredoxin family protein